MSNWSDYYKNRVGESYPEYCAERYKPFVDYILGSYPKILREEGCGIGTISKILLRDPDISRIDLCDKDLDILRLAHKNLGADSRATFNKFDALENPKVRVDLVFGHGVLEHFQDEDIEKILTRQLQSAKKVVHYVPTDGYKTPSFGDERLLPASWWVEKWQPTRFHGFNHMKDLMLIWER